MENCKVYLLVGEKYKVHSPLGIKNTHKWTISSLNETKNYIKSLVITNNEHYCNWEMHRNNMGG